MPEISTILYGQIDEFKAVKAKAVRMRSFKALSSKSCYAIELTYEGASFEMQAVVTVPDCYPDKPCLFELKLSAP